jgi:hypothetical protein
LDFDETHGLETFDTGGAERIRAFCPQNFECESPPSNLGDLRLTQARGDDVVAWRAQWESGAALAGYRRQAVLTLLTLEAFRSPLMPRPEHLADEAVVGLALVCQLSVDQDDEGRLAAAEIKTTALLAILSQEREHVLPDCVERVAALGAGVVPALVQLLRLGSGTWGAIRAARALEQLARRDPSSCQLAIPALIAPITDQEGDFLLEACSDALVAVGAAVVEPIAAALNDDSTRDIYLMGVLSKIPTERSAEIIANLLARDQPDDWRQLDMYAGALADVGSPAAIGVLEPLWKPEDPNLAAHLLVLHVINGRDHPLLPKWRALAQAEDVRVRRLTESLRISLNDADEPLPWGDRPTPSTAPALPAPAIRPETSRPPLATESRQRRRHRHKSGH